MTERTVAAKGHIKPGAAIAVVNRISDIVEALGLPGDVTFVPRTRAQVVLLFVKNRAELEKQMRSVVPQLAEGAALWVFYRKGSKGAGLDMNRDTIWAVAESLNMRPLGLLSVDDMWSAFRLRASLHAPP